MFREICFLKVSSEAAEQKYVFCLPQTTAIIFCRSFTHVESQRVRNKVHLPHLSRRYTEPHQICGRAVSGKGRSLAELTLLDDVPRCSCAQFVGYFFLSFFFFFFFSGGWGRIRRYFAQGRRGATARLDRLVWWERGWMLEFPVRPIEIVL